MCAQDQVGQLKNAEDMLENPLKNVNSEVLDEQYLSPEKEKEGTLEGKL